MSGLCTPLLVCSLILLTLFPSQGMSILVGLKSGEIREVKQTLLLLEKQAVEQRGDEKELTLMLATSIKGTFTAHYQWEMAKEKHEADFELARKQDISSKKWLELNALGHNSPENSEQCRLKAISLRKNADLNLYEKRDQLKEELKKLHEARQFSAKAGNREDVLILNKVISGMCKDLGEGEAFLSLWNNDFIDTSGSSSNIVLLPDRISHYQMKFAEPERSLALTKRISRKVEESYDTVLSSWEKTKLIDEIRSIAFYTLPEIELRKGSDSAVFMLLQEVESLGVDMIQSLTWAQLLQKSPTEAYKKYADLFIRNIEEKLSVDHHDSAKATYDCWMAIKEKKKEAYTLMGDAYSGKINKMIRLNASKVNASYWYDKAGVGTPNGVKKTSAYRIPEARSKWEEKFFQ